VTSAPRFSRQYFDEIESYRYRMESEIFSFAQFTLYRDRKVLEVGVGAGTDFIQWVRAGAKAYGIDLTEEAVEHTRKRLALYGLSAEEVRLADGENLPYPDKTFDLVYSYGVIHHTPDPIKAIGEIIRVTKVGGTVKIMLYNRRSLYAYYRYARYGLSRGRPFRTISDILYHHQESIGTEAFTGKEINNILSRYPVEIAFLNSRVTNYDLMPTKSLFFRLLAYILACLLGFHRCGWIMTIEMKRT